MQHSKLSAFSLRTLAGAALASFAATVSCVSAYAGVLHPDVSVQTYTDFGQNTGRYTMVSNALLDSIRSSENGVNIYYTGGQNNYVLEHGLIDFRSTGDNGAFNAVGNNFIATVAHNGVQNPTFSGRYIGESNSIHYATIEYRDSSVFSLSPDYDYKIARTSKLITDVTGATVYSGNVSALSGSLIYRAGAGTMQQADREGNITDLADAYVYIVGGIITIDGVNVDASSTDKNGITRDKTEVSYALSDWGSESVYEDPLPTAIRGGDSGSPSWVWNEETEQYEYLVAGQAMAQDNYYLKGAPQWTLATMESFDVSVSLKEAVGVITVNAVTDTREGETLTSESEKLSATPTYGTVTDENGTRLAEFVGVKSGLNTWSSLSDLKDTQNWYAYGNGYLNGEISYADLYLTENLVFDATKAETTIKVGADVDLGIGYVEFTAGTQDNAKFTISSENNHQLNSAGYVVGAGVDLHVTISNTDADYMREWRKTGDGNLHIEGSGNNEIFLNLGGNGATYLHQTGGYAAYNVLANNGTTVSINDINQIARDFTFGYGGARLDMNGNSMEWKLANTDVSADGFTINALTEEAIIENLKSGTTATLIYTEGGETTFKGSFVDTADSALKIVANAGEGSVWTLNSIRTQLRNDDSGLEVQSGNVVLSGTNTVHGTGSESGTNANRYFNENDWHYADATTDVFVADGATFRLGSHARLTGDVTVATGGTFVMNEGVKHQYEYIEGGIFEEDTYAIADFYGLKGDVALDDGAEMRVEYTEGTTANTTYSGKITGSGNVSVILGTEGALTLTGTNTFSGTKNLSSGTLVAKTTASLGKVDEDATRWLVESAGVIASEDGANLLPYIHSDSSGVFALTQDIEEQLDLSKHYQLIIGTLAGCKVNYGKSSSGSYSTLKAYDHDDNASTKNAWVLGGGGGELVVYFRLTGDNDLILGNQYGKGTITLANAENDFTGTTTLNGQITLNYVDGALGNSTLALPYGNRVFIGEETLPKLANGSTGVFLADNRSGGSIDISDSQYSDIYLGADGDKTLTSVTIADSADYRFGGVTGTLTLNTILTDSPTRSRNLIVDGQTFSGGKVVLAQAATLSGAVSVIGYDRTQTELGEGNITLAFGANEALANAASVTIGVGGILDLNGTTQSFDTRLTTVDDGIITDSSEDKTGTLVLSYGNSDASLNISGIGTLRLDSGRFSADASNTRRVVINDGGQYYAISGTHASAFTLSGTGWNASNDDAKSGALRLANGAEISGDIALGGDAGVQVYRKSDSGTLSGAIATGDYTLTKLGAGTLAQSGTFSGNLVMAGGTLTLSGSSYSANTSITLNAGTTNLSFGDRAFSGSLIINDGAAANVQSKDGLNYDGSSSVTVNVGGTLNLENKRWTFTSGNKLTLAGGTVSGAGEISGSGEHYGALDFIYDGNVVDVTHSSVISANLRSRGDVDFKVSGNANLEISGKLLKEPYFKANFSKSGAGTLNFSGTAAAGTNLAINEGDASITSQDFRGSISVSQGATLSLAGTFAFANAVSNAGTVTIDSANIIFDLANLAKRDDNAYTLISGGTIENWDSLTKENFAIDGVSISGRSGFAVSSNGVIILDLDQDAASLVWTPQSGSNVWDIESSKNWTNNGSADVFYEDDAVSFSTAGATVRLAESLTSGDVSVTENTTFSSSGTDIALSLIAGGSVSVEDGKTATFDKTLGTSGAFEKAGTGKLIFAADAGSVASSVKISEGTFALSVASDSSASFAGTLSGTGAFEKNGSGTLELASANTHSGGTRVSEGTLKITHKDAFGSGVISVNADAVLDLAVNMDGAAPAYVLNGGTLTASVATGPTSKQIAAGKAIVLTADSAIRANADFGMISGSYAANTLDLGGYTLTKTGTASFFLTNTSVTAGTLRIEAGTLEITNHGTTDASATDFVLAGGTLHSYGTFKVNSVSGDSGTFKVSGGTTTVSGKSEFSGTVSQSGGTLNFLGDVTLATISQSGGTLNISGDERSSVEVASLNSTGTLNISGVSMTLSGTNNLYGTTTLADGAVLDLTESYFADGGNGRLVVDNAKVKISSMAWGSGGNFGTAMWNDRLQLKNGAVLEITEEQSESTGGRRGFAVTEGSGTYLYSGTGTSYISANEISQSVHLANGASLTWEITDADATLVVSKVIGLGLNAQTMTETSGSLVKTGAGTLTLSGANLFNGGISVEAGTLNASGTALGLGKISVSENATLNLGSEASGTLNKNIVGTGTIVWGNSGSNHNMAISLPDDFKGTLQLSGNIDANALARGIGGTQTLIADGVWFWNKDSVAEINLDVLLTDSSPSDSRASGNLYQNGSGVKFNGNFFADGKTVTLTAGTNTFAGKIVEIGTLTLSGGTLNLGSDDPSDGTVGTVYLSKAGKSLSGNLTLKGGAKATVATGSDALNYDGNNTITVATGGELYFNSARWTVGSNNKIVLCGGKITGRGEGSNGALDFYKNNTLTANGGVNSTIEVPIRLRGTLTIAVGDDADSTSSLTISGLINEHGGSRSLTKTGAGTLTLSGANTYSGGTTISGGKLITKNADALGTNSVTNNAALELNFTGNMDNIIGGSGTVSVTGSEVTLSGANTYSGGTIVEAGTLVMGNKNALGKDGSAVVIGKNATLRLKGENGAGIGRYTYTLKGGTLEYGSNTMSSNWAQFKGESGKVTDVITQTENSTLEVNSTFGFVSAGHFANNIALNGKTLTKTGEAGLYLCNTTVSGGTLRIEEGVVGIWKSDPGKVSSAASAAIELVGGSGKLNIGAFDFSVGTLTIEVSASYTGDENATLAGTGSLILGGDKKIVIRYSDAVILDAAAETLCSSYQIAASDAAFDALWTTDSFKLDGWQAGWHVKSYENGVLTVAVPEPSLFGLFAGLGALFLVGSRRRRRV